MNNAKTMLATTALFALLLGLSSTAFALTEPNQSYVLDSSNRISMQVFDEQDLTLEGLFSISGEVGKPGGYPFVPGLNLEQAVAMAGDLTDRTSKRKMYLIKGSSSDNKRKRVKLNVSIDPGDTITIEEGFF